MAIHETKIKWHDLIEDPNDLPIGETKINFIVVYDKSTNTTFKIYDDIAIEYLELCNCWRITSCDYDEDGNPEPHEYVESYKHEPIDSKKLNGYLLYDQVVIAWSEEVEEYIPDIFGYKNKEERLIMSNKEKVIKGLHQHVEGSMFDRCGECAYYEFGKDGFSCRDELLCDALTMLEEQEVRELTIDEWREWKANPKRNPICKLWENDTSPMWILNPNNVHEPALLMGKLKLFTGKPTFEQCKEVKWNDK